MGKAKKVQKSGKNKRDIKVPVSGMLLVASLAVNVLAVGAVVAFIVMHSSGALAYAYVNVGLEQMCDEDVQERWGMDKRYSSYSNGEKASFKMICQDEKARSFYAEAVEKYEKYLNEQDK